MKFSIRRLIVLTIYILFFCITARTIGFPDFSILFDPEWTKHPENHTFQAAVTAILVHIIGIFLATLISIRLWAWSSIPDKNEH